MEAIKRRMNALRIEADESNSKVDELSAKVKTLEQETLSKEQEITSLQHKNSVLETEVEKLERLHGEAKAAADESAQHGTQNEGLTRKLQLLEEEAEENEKNLRETNEKYIFIQAAVKGEEGKEVKYVS
ncbi:tropomyosin-2 [Friedmanniomyces endolithicus]|nr:tropomyosin-2 [Friedmanniomyces endolithicus]